MIRSIFRGHYVSLMTFGLAVTLSWLIGPASSGARAPLACTGQGAPCGLGPLLKRDVNHPKAFNALFVPGNGFWNTRCDVLGEPSHVSMETNITAAGVVPDGGTAPVPETVHTQVTHRARHGVSGTTGAVKETKKLRRRVDGEIVYVDANPGHAWITGSFKVDLELHIPQAAPQTVENRLGVGIAVIPSGRVDTIGHLGFTFETDTLEIPPCIPYDGFARTKDDSDWKRVKPNGPKPGQGPPSEKAVHIHFIANPLECLPGD